MNRVEQAIQEGRCVLVFGGRVLQDAETLGELRRRGTIPATVLSGDCPSPAVPLSANLLAPALTREGGLICLIEVEGSDGVGLSQLNTLVQAATHKPRLTVVARAFNPFSLPSALRLLKFEHEKRRPRDFLFTLPVAMVSSGVVAAAPVAAPAVGLAALAAASGAATSAPAASAAATAAAAADAKKKTTGAPKMNFIGREEELPMLKTNLEAGGPSVVCGPRGVGKRWLVEQALATSSYVRIPDFSVGWGAETDSLYARLALLLTEAGDKRLGEALNNPATRLAPAKLAELAITSLQNDALANKVLVIDHLEHVLRRDGTFHREGRLELLLKALLLGKYSLRVVFLTSIRPRFYREGEGVHLPILDLAGLKGRELHQIFDAYRVEDFPREHFGDIINRIHGHPFATRLFAVAMRDPEHREDLLENKRFFQMESLSDVEPIRRRIQKALETLSPEEKKALSVLAHFRLPFSAADAEALEVDRKMRLALLGAGVLDPFPEDLKERTFRVHSLVVEQLGERETSDYAVLEALGNYYIERARKLEKDKGDGQLMLALKQEGNRFLFNAHRIRNRARMPHPDHDPSLESIRGMVRSKKPRFDLAEQRIEEVLRADPANTEVQLMKAELAIAQKAPPDAVGGIYADIQNRAPTPEAFHAEATWHLLRTSGRQRAASALERGLQHFPESGRMRRRLAGIYIDQNRLDDAMNQLKEAMNLEPMMPDTYGVLGEVYLMKGSAFFDQAEQALAEARRLDPDNGLHMARLGALILERANDPALDDAARNERQAQAEELLNGAVQADAKNYLAHLYLGRLIIDRGGDLERADWLLKKAQKLDERASLPLVERARVAIRQKAWKDAAELTEKAIRLDGACHQAFFTRGQMYEDQGHIFNADQEYRRAVERSPKDSTARKRYEEAIARTQLLIASGAATELQKAAEAAGIPAPTDLTPLARPERKTTQRRPGKGNRGAKGAPAAEAGANGVNADAAQADAGAEDTSSSDDAGSDDAGGDSAGGDDNSGDVSSDDAGSDAGSDDSSAGDSGSDAAGEAS